jgi:hypothetical protein
MRRVTSRREGRLTRFAPAAAVLVVFAAGSGVVLADGGDTSLIHGCLQRQETAPNLIVVGPSDSCPSDTSAIHWPSAAASQPPPGFQAGDSASALDAVPAPKKANKKLYKPLGIKLNDTETVTEVYTQDVPPDGDVDIEGGASCPPSNLYRVSGYDAFTPGLPAYWFPWPLGNSGGPVGEHGWFASRAGTAFPGNTAKLTVSVTCAKVKAPQGKQG